MMKRMRREKPLSTFDELLEEFGFEPIGTETPAEEILLIDDDGTIRPMTQDIGSLLPLFESEKSETADNHSVRSMTLHIPSGFQNSAATVRQTAKAKFCSEPRKESFFSGTKKVIRINNNEYAFEEKGKVALHYPFPHKVFSGKNTFSNAA